MASTFVNEVKANADAIDATASTPDIVVSAAKAGGKSAEQRTAQGIADTATSTPNFRAEVQTRMAEGLPELAKSINSIAGTSIGADEVRQATEIVGERADNALRARSEQIMQGFGNTSATDPYIAARQEGNLRDQANETGAISKRLDAALASARKLDWGNSQPVGGTSSELQMPTVGAAAAKGTKDLPSY